MLSAPDFIGFAGTLRGAVKVLAHLGTMVNALLGGA
jgi:hypothetical protein